MTLVNTTGVEEFVSNADMKTRGNSVVMAIGQVTLADSLDTGRNNDSYPVQNYYEFNKKYYK